jgi:hypothetical protein
LVVPQDRLDSAIPLLAGNVTDLRIFRLTDPEAERFDQVALFGVRKRIRGEHYDRNRSQLVEMVWRNPMPVLSGAETPYSVPPAQGSPLVYRGLPLDQIEDLVPTSAAWQQVAPFLMPKEEVQGGRPITPLHAGHVGLLCTAGLLNGVFGQGSERHIARWRTEVGHCLRGEGTGLQGDPQTRAHGRLQVEPVKEFAKEHPVHLFGLVAFRCPQLPFADTLKYAAGVVPSDFLKAAIKALGVL